MTISYYRKILRHHGSDKLPQRQFVTLSQGLNRNTNTNKEKLLTTEIVSRSWRLWNFQKSHL